MTKAWWQKQLHSWLPWIIIAAAFVVRLYQINAPLADWHSFRQADTASVTREYVKNGIDLLRPKYHDLSNIQSGEDNLEGWRMVEFPIINAVIALILRLNPGWDLVVVSRLASAAASAVSIGAFYWLLKQLRGTSVALAAALAWALMPYAIYYGRVILPEPFVILFMSLALVYWYKWLTNRRNKFVWLLVSGLLLALALLVKPMAAFLMPLMVGLIFERPRRFVGKANHVARNVLLTALTFVLAVIPLLLWRRWILNFPTGIPASDWLFNGNHIRLKPAWWRWLMADRIGRLMFGYWGAALLIFGLVFSIPEKIVAKRYLAILPKQINLIVSFFLTWFEKSGALIFGVLGVLAYLIVFATGNVQHDYYQIILLPIIVWLFAEGVVGLVNIMTSTFRRLAMLAALSTIIIFSWLFSWYHVGDFFHINNPAIVSAGNAVDQLTPPDALVIAPYQGDTAFLWQTNRRGWPIGFEIEEKIKLGAQFYVSTAKDDEVNELRDRYSILAETDEYIIFDLREEI